MICPNCKNKGFEPTEDIRTPIKYFRKLSYDTVNQRQIICLQCGVSWMTMETFERWVKVKTNPQRDLFDGS